jgi:xanthine dehydrogenase accessory factor
VSYANKYIEKLAELDRSGKPFVSVTMVEAIGSTPQDVGSRMLVDSHGLAFGTVGGGRVERKAIEVAQQLLERREVARPTMLVEWNLQNDVGMTCGGVVRLFFETFNVRHWHIVIFGAGHVAQALVRCLLTLDCQVTCIDQRDDWLGRLPQAPRLEIRHRPDPREEVDTLDDDDFIICMTMGHRTDRPILERIFQNNRQFQFLGVIGSRSKRKVLVRELIDAGIDADRAEAFECPIGLPIGNNQPAEIAISIVAQLLQARDAMTSNNGV